MDNVLRGKVIYNIRYFFSVTLKFYLFDALVLSPFSFANAVYGPCLDCESFRFEVVQNAYLRLIYGISRRYHISCKLKPVPWLNVEARRKKVS